MGKAIGAVKRDVSLLEYTAIVEADLVHVHFFPKVLLDSLDPLTSTCPVQ